MLSDFNAWHKWALNCGLGGLILAQIPLAFPQSASSDLTVVTFNVRYDNPADTLPWSDRKHDVANAVRYYDIVGLQEVLPAQREDLDSDLDNMDSYGIGRDVDGGGEACPIYWRRDRFDLLHAETRWLSTTPHAPGSIGWDADLPRIATLVLLFDHNTGKRIRIMNTHWSHTGPLAREGSAALCLGWMGAPEDDLVRVFMGDLNEEPGGSAIAYLAETASLQDAYFNPRTRCRRQFGTYTTFFTDRTAGAPRIDYMWVEGAEVKWHCTDEVIKWGLFISDHAPLHSILGVQHVP